MNRNEPAIKSTRLTFDIIETLAQTNGMTLSAIAEEVGKPITTVNDHIKSLEALEYVIRREDEYLLSMRILANGETARRQRELYSIGKEPLEKLSKNTDEGVSLVIEEFGLGVILYTVDRMEELTIETHAGMRMSLHSIAPGKAILASLPREKVNSIIDRYGLQQYTQNTITERDELIAHLDNVKTKDYILDDEERIAGVRSIAVPIKDYQSKVRGAISLFGPTTSLTEERIENEYLEELKRTKNIIEVNMNYEG